MGTKIPCLTTWRRLNINGAPHWTRTSAPLFRRQLLFPAELTEHKVASSLSCTHAPRLSAPFCWGSLDHFCKRSKCPCINNCCSTGRHCNSVRTKALERMTGVEPAISEWKSEVLPLHYIRIYPPLQVADDCFDYQDDFLNMQAGRHLIALFALLLLTLPEVSTYLTYGYLLSSENGVQSHM